MKIFPVATATLLCALVCSFSIATPALYAAEPSAERVATIAAWLPAQPAGFTEPIGNRAAWQARATQIEFARVIADAEALAASPAPAHAESLFLDYSTTGNRTRWEKAELPRRDGVGILTIAEAIENKGRFLVPLETLIASLCAEKTWVYSAHDRGLKNFRGELVEIDLGVARLSWSLATADAVLGDKLSPTIRALLRENLERRILAPFRAAVSGTKPEFWWMRAELNWNAVCLAGTVGTAQAIVSSPQERAWFIAAAEHYIRHFLAGFGPDGYCSEGLGYWNYGFGNYAMLSEIIRRATGGKLDLLTDPAATLPSFFGARTEILAGIYPSISDADVSVQPSERLSALLSDRFGFPIKSRAPATPGLWRSDYDSLVLTPIPNPAPPIKTPNVLADLAWRTWFPHGGVLISRPALSGTPPFAVCLKGGHNNESHNHNDVGTFMVVSGKTMLICDPGKTVYTARNASSRRYENKVMSSYGHAVPLIAGKEQRAGEKTAAVVLVSRFTPEQDTLTLDLRAPYDVPAMQKLEREFIYRRGPQAALVVTDTVEFSTPSTYEVALITWGKWERLSPTEICISDGPDAVRVVVDAAGQAFELRAETLDEDVLTPTKPIRLGLKVTAPVTVLQFKLTITPELN
jgi:hypothetical protein